MAQETDEQPTPEVVTPEVVTPENPAPENPAPEVVTISVKPKEIQLEEYEGVILVVKGSSDGEGEDDCGCFAANVSALAELFGAIAWPFVIWLLVRRFHGQIASLLSRLKKGKFAGSEFEFEELLDETEREARSVGPEPSQGLPTEYAKLADGDPIAVIIRAWLDVEGSMEELLRSRGVLDEVHGPTPATAMIRKIEMEELLSSENISLLHNLRRMRNEAAHSRGFDPGEKSVLRYLQLASLACEVLAGPLPQTGNP